MDEENNSSSSSNGASSNSNVVSDPSQKETEKTNFASAFNDGSDGDDSEDDDVLPPGMAAPQAPVNAIPDPESLPGAPVGAGAVFHPLANLRAMDSRLQTLQETAAARPVTPPELKKEEIDSEDDIGDLPNEVENNLEPTEVSSDSLQDADIEEPVANNIDSNQKETGEDDDLAVVTEDINNKRSADDGMGLKDELDFEECIESGEEGELGEVSVCQEEEEEEEDKEDGELSDEEENNSLLQNEPKTVCRFFNKGQCTWGTNCRFLHPGVSDKGNYNMFAPGGAVKEPTENKENEGDKEEGKKDDKKDKVTVGGRPRFVPEPNPFETAWERGLRHAKDLIKRSHKRRETDADFEEKRFNLSLGQAELDRENDYYTRPASPVLKAMPSDHHGGFDPYDERQAIRHFRGGYFENFEVRYHVGPQGHGGPPPQGGRDSLRDHMGPGGPHGVGKIVPPGAMERDPMRGRKKHPQERRYPRSPGSQSEEDKPGVSPGGPGGEDWADPWARRGEAKKGKKGRNVRSRSYSSVSHSSRSSSGSSRSSRSRSGSSHSRSYSRSRSRSVSGSPPPHMSHQGGPPHRRGGPPYHSHPPFGGPDGGGYEAHYPPQQGGFFRGGPPNFRGGRGGHFDGGPQQPYFRGRGRGFMRGNFRGRFPYNHHNQGGGPPGANYPPHGGFPGPNGPPGRGRNRHPSEEGGRHPPRDPRSGGVPTNTNLPPHHLNQNNRRFPNHNSPHQQFYNNPPQLHDESRYGGARRGRPSDPRLRGGDQPPPTNPNEKVDAFGRMIRQPKRDRGRRSPSHSRSRSRSSSTSSRSITPPQKNLGRRRRKYSLSPSRSRSRSYSRSRSRSYSSRSHSSDSDGGARRRPAGGKKGVPRVGAGAPSDPRMKMNLPTTSIGFEARNNVINARGVGNRKKVGGRTGTRSRSVSRSRSRSYSSSSSSSSSGSDNERRKKRRNPEDRPRVPINTLAAYTAGANSGVPRYAANSKPSVEPSKTGGVKSIKMSLKSTSRVTSNAPLRNDDDDSGESDTGVNVLGKRKASSPAGGHPTKMARGADPTTSDSNNALSPAAGKKSRREELLRQLRDVEDLIAKKRNKFS